MKRNAEFLQNQDTPAASMLQETPFDNLRLTSQAVLERAQKQGRSKCPRCHGSRMFYCYSCYVPVETVPVEDIPIVKVCTENLRRCSLVILYQISQQVILLDEIDKRWSLT